MILETERLLLREFTPSDAPFVVELLNDPGWLASIGDRGVRTLQQAVHYIEAGPMKMYAVYGFGLYLTQRKADHVPIGMCGLVKRDFLDDVDLGFAFLERYQGQGYAFEAASGVMDHATRALELKRIVAFTTQDNERSARLLQKLGFHFERLMPYPGENEKVHLFACSLIDVSKATLS